MSDPRPQEPEAGPDAGPALLRITYYTDPLCCWSWGFEPQLRRLRYAYAGRLAWRIRMGGMIGDWSQFEDPLNSVHRPSQMGPLWLQAKHVTGMPIEAMIWVEDPPGSSWPACLAVKAAELQSPAAADLYLRGLREAVMMKGRNVAREDVLLDLAKGLAQERSDLFDGARFAEDLDGRQAKVGLQDDVKEARYRGIGRFPCLVIHREGSPPDFLVGWRPYEALRQAIEAVAPGLGPERSPPTAESYGAYWGGATERELEEAAGQPPPPGAGHEMPMSSGAGN